MDTFYTCWEQNEDKTSNRNLSPSDYKSYYASFSTIDTEGQGFITLNQFEEFILGDTSLDTEDKKDKLIQNVNTDGDDKITFDEFAQWMGGESDGNI